MLKHVSMLSLDLHDILRWKTAFTDFEEAKLSIMFRCLHLVILPSESGGYNEECYVPR